jgi:hypothetical protein
LRFNPGSERGDFLKLVSEIAILIGNSNLGGIETYQQLFENLTRLEYSLELQSKIDNCLSCFNSAFKDAKLKLLKSEVASIVWR